MAERDLFAALLALRPLDMPADLLTARPEWHKQAACRGVGPDIFFVERTQSTAPAKALCDRCTVREPCYEAGLYENDGIWAGIAPRARRALRRSAAA